MVPFKQLKIDEYFILIGQKIKIARCSIKLAASLETLIRNRRCYRHPRNTKSDIFELISEHCQIKN